MPQSLNRRQLLGAAAAAGAAATIAVPGAAQAHGSHGHSPSRVPRDQISVQLYTLRNQLNINLETSLAELRRIGYTRVEHAGFVGELFGRANLALLDPLRELARRERPDLMVFESLGEAGAVVAGELSIPSVLQENTLWSAVALFRAVTGSSALAGRDIPAPALTLAENATADRLFSELIELIERGETLTVDSVRQSVYMARTGRHDHVWSDGTTFARRSHLAGYEQPSGENIAWGYRTATEVIQAWMASPGHRANMLNCGARSIGTGVAYAANGTLYYTQVFGWE